MSSPPPVARPDERDATFRAITDALQVGVVVHGAQGEIRYVNPRACELLGQSEDQLLGRTPFHPEWHFTDADGRRLTFEEYPAVRVLTTGEPLIDVVVGSFRPVQQDRIWGLVRATPMRLADGSLSRILVSFTDITALKQAELARLEALRDAERFRNALDRVPAYVYMKDAQSRYVYGNALTLQLFGVSAAELVGRGDEHFFPPSAVQKLRAVDRRVLAGEQTREEVVVHQPDGTTRYYAEVKSPLYDGEGSAVSIGILGISIDVSEQRQLEEQLQQSQRMEAMGRLAGGVAHDFNNMIGVILGRAELALGQVEPSSSVHGDLQEILMAGRRSSDLTRHLLAFARKQAVVPRVLDLTTEVEKSLKLLRRLIPEDIELRWQPDAATWPVYFEPTQLDQVLANLCVNARDAIRAARERAPRGKELRHDVVIMATGNRSLDEAFCASHPGATRGDYAWLSVRDTGCGIPAESLSRVFEPFFTTKPVGEGTGLGLATVFGSVQQGGGFITVESQVDEGSVFDVYFPRHYAAVPAAESEDASPASRGRETILITEDEPALLRLAEQTLTRLGYTVLKAASPHEALSLVQRHNVPIDLLLTDLVMPGMNGRELVQAVGAIRPGMRHLYMSGYSADVLNDDQAVGDHDILLQKPFTLAELARRVREVLDRG